MCPTDSPGQSYPAITAFDSVSQFEKGPLFPLVTKLSAKQSAFHWNDHLLCSTKRLREVVIIAHWLSAYKERKCFFLYCFIKTSGVTSRLRKGKTSLGQVDGGAWTYLLSNEPEQGLGVPCRTVHIWHFLIVFYLLFSRAGRRSFNTALGNWLLPY